MKQKKNLYRIPNPVPKSIAWETMSLFNSRLHKSHRYFRIIFISLLKMTGFSNCFRSKCFWGFNSFFIGDFFTLVNRSIIWNIKWILSPGEKATIITPEVWGKINPLFCIADYVSRLKWRKKKWHISACCINYRLKIKLLPYHCKE